MKVLLFLVAVLLAALPAHSKPTSGVATTSASFSHNVRFNANDAEDSDAMGVAGTCRAAIELAGSDVVSLYHVPTADTAAASGDLIVTFTSTSDASLAFTAKYLYVKAVSTTSATGGSKLNISCSNTQLSSNAVTVVSSFEEMNAVMRANDQVDAGTYTELDRVNVHVKLSEDFVADPTRTTPYTIQLPRGGADHGLVTIDFGNNTMIADALTIVELDYSGGATACNNRYEEDVTGCMGVAHDTEVRIRGGFWSSIYDACDANQTTSCGQAAIRSVNADLLYWASGAGFYGTRISFDNMKCGGQFDSVSEDSPPAPISRAFNLLDDACVELEPGFAQINVGGDQFWEGMTALRVTAADANGGDISSIRITFDTGFHFSQQGPADGDTCLQCLSGLLDIEAPMADASEDNMGVINLNGIQLSGTLGNLRGGNITGHINADWPVQSGVTNCYGAGGAQSKSTDQRASWFINNSMDPEEPLSGKLTVAGEMCVAGWVKTASTDSLRIDAILNDGVPGFFASESDLSSASTTRPFILESCHTATADCTGGGATTGKVNAAEFNFFSDVSLTIGTDYEDFFDESVLTGGALQTGGLDSFVTADFGINGFIYAKHNSTVIDIRDKRALPPGSAFPSETGDSGYPGGGDSMLPGQCRGSYWISTNNTTGTVFTLPLIEDGLNCCFATNQNQPITIQLTPSSGEQIRLNGVVASSEESIRSTSNAAGDYMCLIAEPSGGDQHWRTVGNAGTWQEDTP